MRRVNVAYERFFLLFQMPAKVFLFLGEFVCESHLVLLSVSAPQALKEQTSTLWLKSEQEK